MCSPLNQLGLLDFWVWVVESPLAPFQKEVEVGSWDAVESAQMTLGLVPEVLYPVDVVFLAGKEFGVVDAEMLEGRHIEHLYELRVSEYTTESGTTLVSMMALSVLPFTSGMDLPPFLTQSDKTQNPLNGELSHGNVTQAVHQGGVNPTLLSPGAICQPACSS